MSYLKKEHVGSFLALDKKVYDQRCQVDKETTLARLQRNARTDITVMDGQRMVGYISICPVDDRTFSNIIKGTISEKEIEENTLRYEKPGRYKAYLSSIVIDKEHYPSYKGKYLIHYLQEHLLRLRKQGIIITDIIAVAVSVAGRKTLERFNFDELQSREGVFVYRSDKNKPHFAVIDSHFEALYSLMGELLSVQWGSV